MSAETIKFPETIAYDTDLGSDVDDALALALLVNSVGKRLKIVSTVYGPVDIRARAARTLTDLMGFKDTLIVPGRSAPLSPNMSVWTTGNENYGVDPAAEIDNISVEDVYQRLGDFVLLTTGPLTNTANLVDIPRFRSKCKLMLIMGGAINPGQDVPKGKVPEIEHNFGSDPAAAQKVFESHIPIVLVPVDLTLQHPLEANHLLRFEVSDRIYIQLLNAWIIKWQETTLRFKNTPFYNTVYLHDPIAASLITHSDLFELDEKLLAIEDDGKVKLGSGTSVNICVEIKSSIVNTILDSILKR